MPLIVCTGLFYKNLLITTVKRFIAFASALSQKLIVANILASAELTTSIVSYNTKIIYKCLTLNQEGAKNHIGCTGLPRTHTPLMLQKFVHYSC